MAPLFKINVDGVVFAPQRAVDVGVIIRNEEGEVIAALSMKIKWKSLGPQKHSHTNPQLAT